MHIEFLIGGVIVVLFGYALYRKTKPRPPSGGQGGGSGRPKPPTENER